MVPGVGLYVQLLDECSRLSSALHHAPDQPQAGTVQPTDAEAGGVTCGVRLSKCGDHCVYCYMASAVSTLQIWFLSGLGMLPERL